MKRKMSLRCLLLAAVIICGIFVRCGGDDSSTEPSGGGGNEQPGGLPGYPKGLTVDAFSQTFSNGSKCLGYYAVVDFTANPSLRFRPQHGAAKKPSEHFETFRASGDGTPYVAVNGGFFNSSLQSLSLLIAGGDVRSLALQDDYIWKPEPAVRFFPVRAALGQMADGSFDAAWVYCMKEEFDHPYAFPSALDNDEKTKTFMDTPPTPQTDGARRWQPYYAIGGGPMLVHGGKNVAEENYWKEVFDCGGLAGLSRQPRTAIGLTQEGKLVLVVCDGRNKRGSVGYTLSELADKLISLGCVEGINLDGGGSSTFVGKDAEVLNMPSDTPGTTLEGVTVKERSVPTVIIIAER